MNPSNYFLLLAWRFVKSNRLILPKNQFLKDLSSHPDFPSLFSLFDVLGMYQIEVDASKVKEPVLSNIKGTFISQWPNDELVLVEGVSTSTVRLLTHSGWKHISKEEFLETWEGLVFQAETPPASRHLIFGALFRTSLAKLKYLRYGLVLFLLPIYLFFIKESYHFPISHIFLLITTIIGLVISVFLILKQTNPNSSLLDRFCKIGTDDSCKSVIFSKWGSVFSISLVDWVSLYFFSLFTLLILAIFAGWQAGLYFIKIAICITPLVSTYSLIVQFFLLRRFCTLCLVLVSILVIQFVFVFPIEVTRPVLIDWFSAGILIAACLNIYYLIKRLLLSLQAYNNQSLILDTLNKSSSIISAVLQSAPSVTPLLMKESFFLFTETGNNSLTLILQPYCRFCRQKVEDLDRLLRRKSIKLDINYIFITPPSRTDSASLICANFISFAKESTLLEFNTALLFWYRRPNLKKWKTRYVPSIPDEECFLILEKYRTWCEQNSIYATPAVVYNDKKVPNYIELSDLTRVAVSPLS